MILLIILFFVIGIIAIMFEAVLPFGISAAFGFGIIALSAYVAYTEFGATLAILYCLIALTVALLVTRLVVRSGLTWMTLSPPKKSHAGATESDEARPEPKIGDLARVTAPLRPTGTIEVADRRVSARSVSPEVECPIGATVRLVGQDSIYWVVEQVSPDAKAGEPPAQPAS